MTHLITALAAATALAACVSNASEPPVVDPTGVHYNYVVDSIEIPDSAERSSALGLNLDNDQDGRPDNALGQVMALLLNIGGYGDRVNDEINTRISAGELIHLFNIQAVSLRDAEGVGFSPFMGIDPDSDATDNWPGPEDYEVTTLGHTATGTIDDRVVQASGGTMPLAFALPNVAEPVILELQAAQIEAQITQDGMQGVVGGAIMEADVTRVFIPILQLGLQQGVMRDCDANGVCEADSFGQFVLETFDGNDDNAISLDEVRDSSLLSSLFAPDMDLFDGDGNYNPNVDGIKESSSFGVGFTAVPARFPIPVSAPAAL